MLSECKFWYNSSSSGTNGDGILVRQELAEDVIEVERISDRIMRIKIVFSTKIYNIVSVYAPQVGRPNTEKDAFSPRYSQWQRGHHHWGRPELSRGREQTMWGTTKSWAYTIMALRMKMDQLF